MRASGLAALLLVCLPPHLLAKALLGRSRWPRRFLGAAGWIAGARVNRIGEPVGPQTLLIANHISWLDILVLAGATGCAFVAKDQLGHRLVHWLADQNNTLYVNRENRRDAKKQAQAIGAALEREQPVALFPEGMVGPGDDLLPFRPSLLEAASFAGKDVEIRPAVLDYGTAATEISWHGESGPDNVARVLGRRGTIPVTVRLLPALPGGQDRKVLAETARAAIREALSASISRPAGL